MYVTLHQLSSRTEMLVATHRHAKENNYFALFPLVSEGCIHKIRELNAEIREYLQAHAEDANAPTAPTASTPNRIKC